MRVIIAHRWRFETWIKNNKTLYFLDANFQITLLYVEIKCQLDATEVFIADLIACSTCFGHHYAHHQELKSGVELSSTPDQQLENHSTKYHRQQPLYNTLELLMMGIVVPEICWASKHPANRTHNPQLHTRPATWKPQHEITQAATTV